MNWNKILPLNCYKVLIIVILLSFPYIVSIEETYYSESDNEMTFRGEEIHIGFPFSYVNMEYALTKDIEYASRFQGSYGNFILDIIIAYFICVLLSIGYNKIKEKK